MPLVGLGVSGGIGAYKSVEVARLLQKRGYEVQAIMTRNARRFVGPLTFEAITRRPVISTQWAAGMNADIEHIALASGLARIPEQGSLDAEVGGTALDERLIARFRVRNLLAAERFDVVGFPLPERTFYVSMEAKW